MVRLAGRLKSISRVKSMLHGLRQVWGGRPWWPRCAECSRRIWPWQVGQRAEAGGAWEHYRCVAKRLLRAVFAAKIDEDIFTAWHSDMESHG